MTLNSTMDQFCGSIFWDSNLTWYTDTPELTECMEKSVLVWVPCAMLWLCSILEAYYILHSKEKNIPWNVLSILKLFITCLLIVLTVVDLGFTVHRSSKGEEVFDVDYYSPIIKILTFCLAGTLLYYNRKYGMRASGVLFFFWLLFSLTSIPQLRTEIFKYRSSSSENVDHYPFVSFLIFYPLLVIMFLLNCFADLPPRDSPYVYDKNPCPERASGFLQRLTFSWFDPFTLTGFRRSLTEDDLWALNPQDSSREIVPLFDKYWQRSLRKREASRNPKASYRKSSASVDFKDSKEKKPASILPALCLAFGAEFLFGSFLKLVNDLLTFVPPQLLKYLIGFIENEEVPIWKGYLYAVSFLLVAIVQTTVLAHYFMRMYIVGMKIRTALTSAIYRKSLVMSNAARKESTVGEIVNLMAVDAQRFLELMAYLNMIWSAPLQIALALYFLWDLLGPSVLAGLAVMIILIPINGLIANRVKTLQIRQMKYKDERVKLMNEVLNGIKVLKMYAWEKSFEEQILKIRNKEMAVLKQAAYLNSATSFIWTCAPFLVTFLTFFTYVMSDPDNNVLGPEKIFVSMSLFLTMNMPLGLLPIIVVYTLEVSLVSFGCFVLISDENALNSKTAFVALSLFNILRFPLSMLPNVVSNMIQTSVGIKRLNKFMNCEELDGDAVEHNAKEPNPLVIEHGCFSWGDDPILKNINLNVPAGSLVAVVGTVGSGKSSLLAALLGEMNKTSGRVNTRGSVAYVPQQAWIQNATLQDNILFGRDLNKHKYREVVEMCALKPDFDMLPGGDQTEIGEKGINLSGGQKQRVSLARAVYYDADNYFLDDPLSAVDSHVGKHIFEKVLGPKGMLKEKTRVLVTHGITYLPQTDFIIVLKDGEISESGTYQQLFEKKGAFADFLLQHLTDTTAHEESEEIDIIKQQLENKLGKEEFRDKLQRARSLSESASESEMPASSGDRANSVKKRASEGTPVVQNDLKEKNKLIEVEKTETGSVKWSVYKHYLKSVGVWASIITVLMNVILQVFQIGSSYWLATWSNDNTTVVNGTVDTSKRDMYLGVYGALGFGQAIMSVVSDVTPQLRCWLAARILQVQLLSGVIRSPLSFFETTPLGRILARFSKDVDVLDSSLPFQVSDSVYCFIEDALRFVPCMRFYISEYVEDKYNNMPISILTACTTLFLACLRASAVLHELLVRRIIRAPMTYFEHTPVGRILSRISKDVEVVDEKLTNAIRPLLLQICRVLGTVVVISISTPLFLAVILPIGVVYYVIQRFYVATSRQLKRLESVSRSPIYSHFGESITGATTIRAYGVSNRFVTESERGVDHNQACYYPSCIANRWLSVRLEMIGNMIIFLAALFAVLGRGVISSGLVGLSISYALQITQTLNWLVRMSSEVESNIVAVERIKEYAETEQEASWEIAETAPGSGWPPTGAVQLEGLVLAYRSAAEPVLRGVTCAIRPQDKIGIVGRTGAGKSTLTLGLFRIIEAVSGKILIDGVDISKIGLHQLRSRITIIPQDPVLFSGSLRMNLDPFETYSDEAVWRALEHAHLKTFVQGLSAGLRHEVSEGGENLSVGQRQLVCLARALLRKTPLLVLDEATAAVDLETDDLIQRTIRSEFASCTVLTIAHRLNTIMDSTRVMVLDKGQLVEFAPPAELLQDKNSIFYNMAKDAGLAS